MFGFFIIRKLFDISCISDNVQLISKPLSVVLAECGHFVVTWSVQEYSCGHLVCSQGSCQMITYESQVTLQSQMASTSLQQYSMAGQVLAAAECVPQVIQVGDKPSLQEEFMDFCTSPLPPKVTAIHKGG